MAQAARAIRKTLRCIVFSCSRARYCSVIAPGSGRTSRPTLLPLSRWAGKRLTRRRASPEIPLPHCAPATTGNPMTQRKKPPFRADHVGSLLRPQELHDARAKAKRGEISAEQLRAVQDKHIREAVAKQESLGMQLVTDGEFRRDWWHIDFIHGFDGVELAAGDAYGDAKFKNTEEQPPFMTVKSRIRRTKPSMLEHFKFLKSVAKRTPKFTMPSPAMLHARGLRARAASRAKAWADLTQAY